MAYIKDENGNYKRTVRCGHCYEVGHNKSACPKRKQDLKDNIKRYKKELTENMFAHDWQRDNAKRYLQHSKDQLHKMETRGQNRKCGFCGEEGHTRRSCSHRKAKVAEATTSAIDLRKFAAKQMIAEGFGPGALIQVPHPRHGSEQQVLAVVTSVNFEEIRPQFRVTSDSYFDTYRGINYQYVTPIPDEWSGGTYKNGSCYFKMEYFNIDEVPKQDWYRAPRNVEPTLLSGIAVSEDQLLSEDVLDQKKVSKWITDNVVDPR